MPRLPCKDTCRAWSRRQEVSKAEGGETFTTVCQEIFVTLYPGGRFFKDRGYPLNPAYKNLHTRGGKIKSGTLGGEGFFYRIGSYMAGGFFSGWWL